MSNLTLEQVQAMVEELSVLTGIGSASDQSFIDGVKANFALGESITQADAMRVAQIYAKYQHLLHGML